MQHAYHKNVQYVSEDARDLIEKLICMNPTHLIKLSETVVLIYVLTHPPLKNTVLLSIIMSRDHASMLLKNGVL